MIATKNENKLAELATEFDSQIITGLPWAQIINVPNLSEKQLHQIQPKHGFFISANNAGLAELEIPEGIDPYTEIEFGGGSVTEVGFLMTNIRFMCIARTPLVILKDGEVVGTFYENGQKTPHAELAARNPQEYRRRQWWLIILLNKQNKPSISVPLKLSLSGATGAAFSQELKKSCEDIEAAFFKELGRPQQKLTEKAKSYAVHDWTLGWYKPNATNAPFEVPISRLSPIDQPRNEMHYKSENKTRGIDLVPSSLEEMLIRPSSDLGQLVDEWRNKYQNNLFSAINYANRKTNGNSNGHAAVDAEVVLGDEPKAYNEVKAIFDESPEDIEF